MALLACLETLLSILPEVRQEAQLMKIATFNINGIKARLNALCDWLDEAQPDVALLQEIKSVDEAFPRDAIEDRGYTVHTHGQKSFNGVAILSKLPLENISRGLPGDESDEQARWIEATVMGEQAIHVCGLYLPNGNPTPGPKYDYKLAWMERLYTRAQNLIRDEIPAMMLGDYNIIQKREDAATPDAWMTDALFRPESRTAFQKIMALGFTDALRAVDPHTRHFSFWDYQEGAWQRDDGILIDHILMTPACADLLLDCQIDKHIRDREKPSDHVPVWVKLNA